MEGAEILAADPRTALSVAVLPREVFYAPVRGSLSNDQSPSWKREI